MRRKAERAVVATFVVVTVMVAAAFVYAVVAPGLTGRAVSSHYETTSTPFGQRVTFVGTCSNITYFEPDTVQMVTVVTTVTTVYNGTTTQYLSTYRTGSTTIYTGTPTTYSTIVRGTVATTYVVTSTSFTLVGLSGEWSVTVCTFVPRG